MTAAGSGTISYRWRKDDVNLADEPNHTSGANTAMVAIVNVIDTDTGGYSCLVSNACGSVASSDVPLTICNADFNCDGTVNSQDFFYFLGAFFGSVVIADFNHDGVINSQDFFDFLSAFFAGCP